MEYLPSDALAILVNLMDIVANRGGQIVFCNVSDHVREILEAANLNNYWLTVNSLEEALKEIEGFPLAM